MLQGYDPVFSERGKEYGRVCMGWEMLPSAKRSMLDLSKSPVCVQAVRNERDADVRGLHAGTSAFRGGHAFIGARI